MMIGKDGLRCVRRNKAAVASSWLEKAARVATGTFALGALIAFATDGKRVLWRAGTSTLQPPRLPAQELEPPPGLPSALAPLLVASSSPSLAAVSLT